jgi:hypothetical protein
LLILLLSPQTGPSQAQGPLPPRDEADTAAFITQNFTLQTQYRGVHCVAQNGDCPAQVDLPNPCLISACAAALMSYPVAATYDTLQAAAEAAGPGEAVVIMPGRYAGVMLENTGGEEGAYIHFMGLGDLGQVVIDRVADPSKSWLRHQFYFINTHHYLISNLVFEGSDEGAGLFFSGYFSETGSFSHHMIVQGVYSRDHYKWGMHSTAASYLLVQDSVFTNSADEHGLYVSGSGDNILIRRNVFQGNNAAGVQVNPDPQSATMELFYWLQNSTGDTCGWTEEEADFTGAAQWEDIKACYDGQGLPDLGGFIEDGVGEKIIIEQNIITGNGAAGGAGINLASLRDSIVRNNLIYGNAAAGIACWDNAYSEDKGLASSDFGCQNVLIYNNTLVDSSGGRGALILNRDAQNMGVYNNLIVRDRYDAYEVAANSGAGLRSDHNYYFAQYTEDSPGFAGEGPGSITGFTIEEALGQFVAPGFEAWIIAEGGGYLLNPARPDYHLRPGSPLVGAGTADFMPAFDLMGAERGLELGALVAGD